MCIRLCVCVSRQSFPNEIDFSCFSPAFKGGQTESSSHQVHKLSLLVEMSGGRLFPASPDCQVKSSGPVWGKFLENFLQALGGAAVQPQRASDEHKNAVELLLLLALR